MRKTLWNVMAVGVLASGLAGCSSGGGNTPGFTAGSSGSSTTTSGGGSSAGGSSGQAGGSSSSSAGGGSSAPAGGSSSASADSSGTPGGSTGGKSTGNTGGKNGGNTGGNSTGATGGKAGGNGGTSTGSPGGSVAGNAGGQSSAGTGGQTGTTGGSTGPVSTDLELMTSAENAYWKTGTASKVTSGTADVSVDVSAKGQRWDGFGGTFNEMGWDALSALSATEVANAMKLLYDPKDGAGFLYGRIPLGASDYSSSWYTLDDLPSGSTDYTMDKFSIARDKQKLIPFIKEAMKVRSDIHFWASPWVIPSWMMDSGSNMKSDAQTMGAHALYMARFAEEYAKEGIKIEAIHPQNEPGYGRVHWKQDQLITFMKTYLGPKLAERSPTTQVWCGTMSKADGGGYDMAIAAATAADAEAMKVVKGFGLQWNLHDVVGTLAAKGVPVMQTEHRCGNYNFGAPYWDDSRYSSSKPQNDHLYGEESWQGIRDWIVAGVNSYSAWNMVLDTVGKSLDGWPQNALLVVDKGAKKLIVTPAYYTFKHFSYYIAPGATRVGISAANDAYKGAATVFYGSNKVAYDLVNAFAFKNPDGSIILQVYNKGAAAKKTTADVGGGLYQFDVPAHGWATLRVPQ
jgi:glucosylceramidase